MRQPHCCEERTAGGRRNIPQDGTENRTAGGGREMQSRGGGGGAKGSLTD